MDTAIFLVLMLIVIAIVIKWDPSSKNEQAEDEQQDEPQLSNIELAREWAQEEGLTITKEEEKEEEDVTVLYLKGL